MKTASCQTALAMDLLGTVHIGRDRAGIWLSKPSLSSLSGPWIKSPGGWPPGAKHSLIEGRYLAHLNGLDPAKEWRRCCELAEGAEPVLVSSDHPADLLTRRLAANWFMSHGFGGGEIEEIPFVRRTPSLPRAPWDRPPAPRPAPRPARDDDPYR